MNSYWSGRWHVTVNQKLDGKKINFLAEIDWRKDPRWFHARIVLRNRTLLGVSYAECG